MFRSSRWLVRALVLIGALATPPDAPADELDDAYTPHVYQRSGDGAPMSATVLYEAAYGTRESRNFASEGVEQGLRLRFQPLESLAFEAFGGVLLDPSRGGRPAGEAVSVEVIGRALDQDRHHVDLHLGAGWIRDYRGDHIPRVRLAVGRSSGRLDLALAGLIEVPVGSAGRDEADVMVALAASWAVTRWFRQGIEAAGEDLEGFFEREEAEGGAKVLFGPTWAFDLPANLLLRLNLAAVYAHVSNQVDRDGRGLPAAWGFMGRLVFGWRFL